MLRSYLRATSTLSVEQLARLEALSAQEGVGGLPLPQIIVANGYMSAGSVAGLLADLYGTRRVRLLAEPCKIGPVRVDSVAPDPSLSDGKVARLLLSYFVPLRWVEDQGGRTLEVAFAKEPDAAAVREAKDLLGVDSVRPVLTTAWDIKSVLMEQHPRELADHAANTIYHTDPSMSARTTFTRLQKFWIVLSLAVLLGCFVYAPLLTGLGVAALMSFAFAASIVFKYRYSLLGAKLEDRERGTSSQLEALTDEELPVYTVLVPVYREERIVQQLVKHMGALDWPQDKLEVLILTEEDDDLTREAIARSNPPANFRVVTVPNGQPRTKPRACNLGLLLAEGKYITIFDAEDAPDADQLKKAHLAFANGGEKLVCVQAELSYFNASENVLTRMFSLEYNFWFDYLLKGLEYGKQPLPLGGTSNHFKRDALVKLGGWDAWNVTEDADLGIRAAVLGYTVGTIPSTTLEEANTSVPNFIRQRSRWVKGYMQTVVVHARHPLALVRRIGMKQTAAFFLLIAGTPFTFLAVLPLYAVSITLFTLSLLQIDSLHLPMWAVVFTLLNFVLGNGLMVHLSMLGPLRRLRFDLVWWALLNPVYWLLHSVSAYKALWQLLRNPHYWEKTEHGLTKQVHGVES